LINGFCTTGRNQVQARPEKISTNKPRTPSTKKKNRLKGGGGSGWGSKRRMGIVDIGLLSVAAKFFEFAVLGRELAGPARMGWNAGDQRQDRADGGTQDDDQRQRDILRPPHQKLQVNGRGVLGRKNSQTHCKNQQEN
jgi:hypothetical protein